MVSIINYATVEMLRSNLPKFISSGLATESITSIQQIQTLEMGLSGHQVLAGYAAEGITAGRSYGGCPGQVELSTNSETSSTSTGSSRSPQEAFGGNSSSNSYSERVGRISRDKCNVPACPTKPHKVEVGGCGVCTGICQKIFDIGKDPTKMTKAQIKSYSSIMK